MRVLRLITAFVIAIGLSPRAMAAFDGPQPGEDSPAWDGETYWRYFDPDTGVSFDVPMLGFHLETRHFDAPPDELRVRHTFIVSSAEGPEVAIEVFDNPDALSLVAFFDRHFAWMRGDEVAVSQGVVGQRRRPAIVIEQPRSPQMFAQRTVVLQLDGRVHRVTCANRDEPRALAVFERVLDSLTAAGAPQ